MTWQPCERHHFLPIPGWSGRYRCPNCKTIAYRKLVAPRGGPHHDDFGRPLPIKNAHVFIPYKCRRCHGDSTVRNGMCPACKEPV